MEYVDFLVTLRSLSHGKEIIKADVPIKDTQAYDVHCSVLASSDEFQICMIEDGWVAFVFQSKVLIYSCGCVDQLLTPMHIQSIQN